METELYVVSTANMFENAFIICIFEDLIIKGKALELLVGKQETHSEMNAEKKNPYFTFYFHQF